MSYIFVLMGKSSSGKDSIYKRLISDDSLGLKHIVPGTTRPIREGETDGEQYYFYSREQLNDMKSQGKIIESRDYNTVHGVWSYFTVADENVKPDEADYIMISTLEGYNSLVSYYGAERVVPIYITVDDGTRLERALLRERLQSEPKYAEMCRRFLGDEADFSEEKLEKAGIETSFENIDLASTVETIKMVIQKMIRTRGDI